jgi:hypothetical protein
MLVANITAYMRVYYDEGELKYLSRTALESIDLLLRLRMARDRKVVDQYVPGEELRDSIWTMELSS